MVEVVPDMTVGVLKEQLKTFPADSLETFFFLFFSLFYFYTKYIIYIILYHIILYYIILIQGKMTSFQQFPSFFLGQIQDFDGLFPTGQG